MANTPINGSGTFPANANEFYELVEQTASQRIREAKNTNRIEDAFYEYPVENGSVIIESMIEMLAPQELVKTGQPDFSPSDPNIEVKYFSNWEEIQFETTTRRTDVKRIIANQSMSAEEFSAKIIGNLSNSEGWYDYKKMRDVLNNQNVGVDLTSTFFSGKVPGNMKGINYTLRELFNELKATNKTGNVPFDYGVDVDMIRIAISESLLNLNDITELANVFNIQKEDLFGKLVIIPRDINFPESKVVVYDKRSLGRGTRLYEYSQDIIGKGLYTKHYLSTDRCYFYNPLFKCVKFDLSHAVNAVKDTILVVANRGTAKTAKTAETAETESK